VKLELIQPFINAADAVLAQMLACNPRVTDVSMDTHAYSPHGFAAEVALRGDVEGRIVFDLAEETAARVASALAGEAAASDDAVHEVICELANQVIGNAITSLNDRGFRFRVQPPQPGVSAAGPLVTEDTDALVMRFDTSSGPVFMNIALRFPRERFS
jgi:chemotaxis protein CheX